MRTHLLTGLLGLCLSIGILYSCKKDEPTPLPEERQLVEEARLALKTQAERNFFDFDYLEDHHALILPEGKLEYRDAQGEAFVQQVMDKILLQNAAEGFVPELISRIGYPAWSRSEVILENSNMHRVAFIPFIRPGENKISAYLMAFKPEEAWWFRLIEKERLKQALIQNESSLTEDSKKFYAIYDLSFDMALFDTTDSLIQDWVWNHIDTEGITGQDNIDFRCTTYPVETGICIRPGIALHDNAIEERTYDCPGNLVYAIINEYIVYGADCWNSNGYQFFPGGEDWYGNPGGLGTVPITYNNHPYLLPIMTLCNEIDQVQSGEVVNGQTYSQADIDRCNQIQQVIYYTMISPNDLAWLLSNNTEAFTDIATYVSNGDRTPLQLQGVSAYIRLLVQGRVNIPLREFMPKYQIVFGELVPVLGLTEEEGWELFENHDIAAFELSIFLNEASDYNELEYEDAAVKAAKIIVKLLLADKFNGPYNQSYYNILNEVESFQDPVLWAYLFTTEVGFLRLEHPDWGSYRIAATAIANILVDQLHLSLDLIGLIPAAGEVADLTNGAIYSIQGEGVNASLSFAAAIPIYGWTATGVKWARMTITGASGRKIALNFIDDGTGKILFGDRSQLRRVIKPPAGHKAHHIIPWEHNTHPVVQQAAKARINTFHMNDHINGAAVTELRHTGSHDQYNLYIRQRLDAIGQIYGENITPDQAVNALNDLINGTLRPAIINNPNVKINDLFP